jgi:hypothetical protein
MLYLVLTVLCIFYLIVISIDWYDGVIRLARPSTARSRSTGVTATSRSGASSFPSIVLMTWKIITVLRKQTASAIGALLPRRSRSAGLLGYDGTPGYVRMDQVVQPGTPVLPEIVLSSC